MMTEILFYHLERASLQTVLPDLLEKSLSRGWRATVRCASSERVAALDAMLWTYRDDSFLPHGADDMDRQPVFLTNDATAPGAEVLFLVDGAVAQESELPSLQRCVMIIDGADAAAVEKARAFWTTAKAAGLEATYWKQSDAGRWERHA